MLFNASWISAAAAVATLVAHLVLYIINRRVQSRIELLESRILLEIHDVKSWTMEHFVARETCTILMAATESGSR
jgi:hypothetical protein